MQDLQIGGNSLGSLETPEPRAAAALRLAPIRAVGLIEINF
jgi:hypothetical protein